MKRQSLSITGCDVDLDAKTQTNTSCGNPYCQALAHAEPTTGTCGKGHAMIQQNITQRPKGRVCKRCQAIRNRKAMQTYYQRRKAKTQAG